MKCFAIQSGLRDPMAIKEKARLEGEPIPKAVLEDASESKLITIALQGQPQGKGRARAFLRGGNIGHYTPEKTRTYEGMIRTAAMQEIGNNPPLDGPIEFVLRAIFAVPASWSERKRQQAILGEIKPGKKPDLDNIAKAWNDALNGVAYRDDALICRMTLDKRYGPQALVVVTVRPVGRA
jgi:Holliday junction resolvase RusA-like endonuclease